MKHRPSANFAEAGPKRLSRRHVLGLGAGAAVWPFGAIAQQSKVVKRLGYLTGGSETDPVSVGRRNALISRLSELGWAEGESLIVDQKFLGGLPTERVAAKELVASRPDVLVAASTPTLAALAAETTTIPIVCVGVTDPVGQGLVKSLAHPDGNITGLILFEAEIANKWIDYLLAVAPRLRRIAFLYQPDNSPVYLYFSAVEKKVQPRGVTILHSPARTAAELAKALDALATEPDTGVVVPPDAFLSANRSLLIQKFVDLRLPNISSANDTAAAGALMSYGVNYLDHFRQAAPIIDAILRGGHPGDIPIQASDKYELVINLKTARAIGVTVPTSLISLADQIIE